MTAILGLSAHFHDAAAALIVDGEIVAAMEEERASRKKHDAGFPSGAIDACLAIAGLRRDQLDYVAYYEKPLAKFDRIVETHLAMAPRSFGPFRRALPRWLGGRLNERRSLRRELGHDVPIVFLDHHAAHAAAAFLPSPFDEAAIVTADGVGEWSTTTIAHGRGAAIDMLREQRFPHSLGLLYNAFTQFLGFEVNEGEYKVMGLSPYGEPRFVDTILEHIIDLRDDGSFRLDPSFFEFLHGMQMISPRFSELFGPPRAAGAALSRRDVDLAASIQSVTEEILLRIARTARTLTSAKNLCLGGGCAHNSVAAGRILRERIFDDVWVQPAAGDAGGALGAALYVHHVLFGGERVVGDRMAACYLGPSFDDASIRAALAADGGEHQKPASEDELLSKVVEALVDGKVVGWFQGRLEFGPRALGGRSILADPRIPDIAARVNRSVKMREAFRPFAPAVLRERVHEVFDVPPGTDMPYMTFVVPVRSDVAGPSRGLPEIAAAVAETDLRPIAHGSLPAITHVDNTARIQTVDARHGRYAKLLEAFHAATGCAVLLNTSFNVRGEPIVCSPADALRCLRTTDIDLLVLGDHLVPRVIGHPPAPRPKAPEPSPRAFGLSFGAALCLLGFSRFRTPTWCAVLVSVGVAVAVICWVAPALGKWIERGVRTISGAVIGVVAPIVLALVYLLLLTPIALLSRLRRPSALALTRDPAAKSYFVPKVLPADPDRAFRMY